MKHLTPKHKLLAPIALLTLAALASAPAWAQLPPPPVSPAPIIKLEYDAQGNPTKTIQAPGVLNYSTSSSYDPLHRRKDSTDAKAKTTLFEYNGREDLTKVTDPRGLPTQYPRNGLGDPTSLISPDTGTAISTYDAAGNLKTRFDSRNVLATYSYDPLNRPTSVVYSKAGQSNQTITWTYDQEGAGFSNGVGRLTSTTYPAGVIGYTYDANYLRTSTTYATGTSRHLYDPQGRLVTVTQTAPTGGAGPYTLSVGYTYDPAGHITGITYPSGRRLNIVHTDGQPSSITLAKDAGSSPQTLISQIELDPFGGPRSWQWQMGASTQAYERVRDTYGRLVRYRMGDIVRDITYDAADRSTRYTHYDAASAAANTALDQEFTYDEVGRLIGVITANASWVFGYDDNGNRRLMTLNGNTSVYTVPNDSNRLTAVSNPARSLGYDAAGNTLTDSGASTGYTAEYDLTNRLSQMGRAGARSNISFVYDAFGQRVAKTPTPVYTCDQTVGIGGQPIYVCAVSGASAGLLFAYDQQGQILGEYDSSTGAALREYVWLGSTPVAMFTPGSTAQDPPLAFYFHTDHLDTPRVVVDQANNLRWRWIAEPFGTTAPETNPQGLGHFTQNLRMPGQYADADTGLFYNYFRDYDSSTGRYVQSDPIGLDGGINTYAYVGSAPTMYVDPSGLTLQDVRDILDKDVKPKFADIRPRGKLACDVINGDKGTAYTNTWTGNMFVHKKYCEAKCLSRDEYKTVFWELFHEGAHSTDSFGTRFGGAMQDVVAPGGIGAHHWTIYNRQFYEDKSRRDASKPMWGTPNLTPVDVDSLYEAYRRRTPDCQCGQ